MTTTIDTERGVAGGGSVALAVLRSQRSRLGTLFGGLSDEAWASPSRCSAWSVHDVARHLVDASERATAGLNGTRVAGGGAFDPRTTPIEWLEASAGQSPQETLAAFLAAATSESSAVERGIAEGLDHVVGVPYGTAHWTVLAVHVFWDAWLHERDIVLPLGRAHDAPELECRWAAVYSLLLACVPLVLMRESLVERVVLDGRGGGTFSVEVRDGVVRVAVDEGDQVAAADALRGRLESVVDSIAGRGPELAEVLDGPADRVERLSMLRPFMLPAG